MHRILVLTAGGLLAVEVGEGQSRQVAELMEAAGLERIGFRNDFSGIERVVFGTAPRNDG